MLTNTRKYFFITTLVVFILGMMASSSAAFMPPHEVSKEQLKKEQPADDDAKEEVILTSLEEAVVPFLFNPTLFKALALISVLVLTLVIIKGEVRAFAFRPSYLKKLSTSCLAINAP